MATNKVWFVLVKDSEGLALVRRIAASKSVALRDVAKDYDSEDGLFHHEVLWVGEPSEFAGMLAQFNNVMAYHKSRRGKLVY